jgi:hypothetical protein
MFIIGLIEDITKIINIFILLKEEGLERYIIGGGIML